MFNLCLYIEDYVGGILCDNKMRDSLPACQWYYKKWDCNHWWVSKCSLFLDGPSCTCPMCMSDREICVPASEGIQLAKEIGATYLELLALNDFYVVKYFGGLVSSRNKKLFRIFPAVTAVGNMFCLIMLSWLSHASITRVNIKNIPSKQNKKAWLPCSAFLSEKNKITGHQAK